MSHPHTVPADAGGAGPGSDGLAAARQLIHLLPSPACLCDRDGIVLAYNRRAAELWGRAPQAGDPALRYCGASQLFAADGHPLAPAETPMAEVLRSGRGLRDVEIVIGRPDGSRVLALLSIEPLHDAGGGIAGAIGSFSDITGRATQLPPAWLPAAWQPGGAGPDSAHDLLQKLPVAVYTIDESGRLTSCNDAAIRLWGGPPEPGARWGGFRRLLRPDGTPLPTAEHPMAQAMREGRELTGIELVAERPDGSRVPFLSYPVPLRDARGRIAGGVNTLIDLSWRARGEVLERRLAAIVESTDDAIISLDTTGNIASWNRGAERLYGYAAAEVIGRPVALLIPEDRQGEEEAILERVRRGERVPPYETVRRRKDGSLVDVSLTASPVTGVGGQVVGASKIARDISEARRAQERQRLLLQELNHRVKNLFAVARGVVALSTRYAQTPKDLAAAVQDRLAALARAHELTVPDISSRSLPGQDGEQVVRSAALTDLVQTILSPYAAPDRPEGEHIRVAGPPLAVGGGALTSLAMLLHEWATNAAKHGALSRPEGRLEISWQDSGDSLRLVWSESGGPPLPQERPGEGFGTFLTRGMIEGQLGGRIRQVWRPEGLRLELELPLQRLSSGTGTAA